MKKILVFACSSAITVNFSGNHSVEMLTGTCTIGIAEVFRVYIRHREKAKLLCGLGIKQKKSSSRSKVYRIPRFENLLEQRNADFQTLVSPALGGGCVSAKTGAKPTLCFGLSQT